MPRLCGSAETKGRRSPRVHWCRCVFLFAFLIVVGCGAQHYRESADREAYRIIERKQKEAFGEARPFSVEPPTQDRLTEAYRQAAEGRGGEEKSLLLTLPLALEIAAKYSRSYQTQKEVLYLAALDLSLTRFQYRPHLAETLKGQYRRTDADEEVEGDSAFSISQLLATGGTIGLSLTTDLLRFLTGDPRQVASSQLAVSLTQPLWRGAGWRIAQENLTQAERDAIYALRSFERFRQSFAVNVASSFYRALQQRDAVRNAENHYRTLARSRERAEALAEAGRLPSFQVDQAKQDELSARDRWQRTRERYADILDDLKIQLGIPVDVPIALDEDEISRLRQARLKAPKMTLEEALELAPHHRLDFLTVVDRVADAERKVEVARNGLSPDLDLNLGATVATEANKPFRFRSDTAVRTAGLGLNLPINRKAERNAYRAALIRLEQSRREQAQAQDELKRDVRRAWRRLDEARESYRIQEQSVALAQRRVESVSLLLEAGRASTRDLLEAQNALLSAQDALTAALVDYRLALLELWRDTGLLRVDERGIWQGEVQDE